MLKIEIWVEVRLKNALEKPIFGNSRRKDVLKKCQLEDVFLNFHLIPIVFINFWIMGFDIFIHLIYAYFKTN